MTDTSREAIVKHLRHIFKQYDNKMDLLAADMLEADAQEIKRLEQCRIDEVETTNKAAQASRDLLTKALNEAQQVAVPAWVPVTESLLASEPNWLSGPLWVAGRYGVSQATYEWRQGRYPHCFDTDGNGALGLDSVTHVMPCLKPAAPQGDKP